MPRSGPAPKPTALRVLQGDKPYRINRDEPLPRSLPPTPPEWLSVVAREEWDRVAPDMEQMGTVKAVDASALAAYCEAVARLRAASDLVTKAGLLLVGRDKLAHKNPAVAMARDASSEVRMWAREFGFTSSARQPLRVQHIPGDMAPDRLLS